MEQPKPKRAVEIGPTGQRVAKNVEQLRDGVSQARLAQLVEDAGRPMTPQIIGKIERLERRIDVDDLVTLAIALDTTPNRLLLPRAADSGTVELTPAVSVSALDAWKWATGEEPLSREYAPPERRNLVTDDRERWFVRESRPHAVPDAYFGHALREDPEVMRAIGEVARLAHERKIPLLELRYFLDFLYTVPVARDAYGNSEGED